MERVGRDTVCEPDAVGSVVVKVPVKLGERVKVSSLETVSVVVSLPVTVKSSVSVTVRDGIDWVRLAEALEEGSVKVVVGKVMESDSDCVLVAVLVAEAAAADVIVRTTIPTTTQLRLLRRCQLHRTGLTEPAYNTADMPLGLSLFLPLFSTLNKGKKKINGKRNNALQDKE
eukprot:Hpha_TRINITY_DN9863_c0_g1::TRINITY_DN9863_c0_g1_i1::g.81352::m.81352